MKEPGTAAPVVRQGPPAVFSCTIPDVECAACAVRVEEGLRRQEGVVEVRVSAVGQRCTVEYDPGHTDPERLARAVREAGYTPVSGPPSESGGGRSWRDRRVVLAALSGCLLAVGLALGSSAPEIGSAPAWFGRPGWSEVTLLAAILAGGWGFFGKGLLALRRLALDMHFLMTAAIVGAVAIGDYGEAATIAFLFSVAELLEEWSVARARRSLRLLVELSPRTATVRRSEGEVEVPAAKVERDEVLLIRPGDRIAADGIVDLGASDVDQSNITGESVPVPKAVGDEVYAGTVNHEGYLEVKVTRRAGESTLAQIIHLVEQAEERRAPSEQFVHRFARYYTPAVVAVAVALMVGPALLFGADAGTWFIRGLTLLVIACPCALVISTPVAVVSAITAAARQGVLIKGGIHLEALARVRVVALDKTGTVTRGRMRVSRVIPLDGVTGEEVLRLAAAAEQRSRHPIAAALVEAAGGDRLPSAEEFESLTGMGVRARIGGVSCTVGRPALFGDSSPAELAGLGGGGTTVVLVGAGERVIGAVALTDTVRPGAREAVQALRSQGLTVVMLTGDHPEAAAAVAAELGIEEWHAGLLPQEKLAWVERLERERGPVAMVGDGVNDAPALARATVGIAMSVAGSQMAMETADVALMGEDLRRLPALLDLGRRTFRVVRQNVWASILIKLSLAAGVFPGWVHLAQAVLIGDTGVSLAVTANALRLAGTQLNRERPSSIVSPIS